MTLLRMYVASLLTLMKGVGKSENNFRIGHKVAIEARSEVLLERRRSGTSGIQ